MEIEYLTDSKLNADLISRAEFTIESNKIESKLNSKVSDTELNETITEVSNDFTQKIGESEASTESKINVAKNNAINTSENYTNAQLANRPTKTEMTSAITQSASETEAKAEILVQQKIEDIQIGGTNLGRKGCISPYNSNGNTTVNNTNFDKNGSAIITRKAFMNEGPMLDRYVRYEVGQKYVISFEFKTSTSTVTSFNIHNGTNATNTKVYVDGALKGSVGQQIPFTPDGNYHKIELRFKAGSNQNPEVLDTNHIIFQPDKLNSRIYTGELRYFKIEKGDKKTDWSPAPEDKANTTDVEAKLELKVEKDNYTPSKVISKINAAADVITLAGGSKIHITTAGKLIISAGNFKLDESGNINCTGGTIGGFTLSPTKFSSNASGIYNYSYDDLRLCMNVYRGNLSVDSSIKKVLDYSNNGSIELGDASLIARVLSGDISNTKTVSGKFEIDSNNPKHFVSVKDGDKVVASIGLGGINSMIGSFQTICVSNATNTSDTTGVFINGSNGTVVATGEIKTGDRKVITSTYQNNQNIGSIGMVYGTKDYVEVLTGNGAYGIDAWASDKRLKRRVKDSKYNALDTIMKIKHRQFIYRKSNEKVLIGYIADELQEIDKQLIFEVGPQKIKQPSESYIIPILSKAIQEQQEIIENQNKRITELETQVKKLLELVEGNKEV